MTPLRKEAIKEGLLNTLLYSRFSRGDVCGFDDFMRYAIAKVGLMSYLPMDVCHIIKDMTINVDEFVIEDLKYYVSKFHLRYLQWNIERKLCKQNDHSLYQNFDVLLDRPFTFDEYIACVTCDICENHYCVNNYSNNDDIIEYRYPRSCAFGCNIKCDECDHINRGVNLTPIIYDESILGLVEYRWEYLFRCENCGVVISNVWDV
jgi:hypothetical protein